MMIKTSTKQQRGVALITVMLVLAICVIIASRMSAALIFQVQRTENINSNQQAYWYAMGAEAFGKTVLALSFQDNKDKTVTHLGQPWAAGETAFPVDLGEISGEIKDLQSCFNLNALNNPNQSNNYDDNAPDQGDDENNDSDNDPDNGESQNPGNGNDDDDNQQGKEIKNKAKQAFIELVSLLDIEGVDRYTAEAMAEALQDWLDEDSMIAAPGGAEDNDYASREYPYLAANSLMVSSNELRLVEHFSAQAILALQDYVCVIPNSHRHQININTLDEEKIELLQALFGGIDSSTAEEILAERGEEGFKDLSALYDLSVVKGIKNQKQWRQQFVVDSDYFMLTTKTSFNDSYFSMKSVMKINEDESISVVDRTIGAN
ncbi:type II secretion system minor pseudopilin GspK [Thalassotalea sp. Y01]|uniref:type II secretion system minor pseudopilin GspK n=1 Tax=Thalassotalea sp. Y01 TaxID=2729613 RepID=UPI00145CFBBC|nr:type II secretion system minor pseudopilin GspK [Thalassotalea sp. Y01]NMP17008.1 type II secretion system minor pseudopilin GspK [Thalassotalea sp. Y01]